MYLKSQFANKYFVNYFLNLSINEDKDLINYSYNIISVSIRLLFLVD